MWYRRDERQRVHVFEYTQFESIYHISSLSSSPLYFHHLHPWPCILQCSLDCKVCVLKLQSANRPCMYAHRKDGWYEQTDFAHAEKERLNVKMSFFIKAIFIPANPPEILSTDKGALRRYNHSDALILSKISLVESLNSFLWGFVFWIFCEDQLFFFYTWVTMLYQWVNVWKSDS